MMNLTQIAMIHLAASLNNIRPWVVEVMFEMDEDEGLVTENQYFDSFLDAAYCANEDPATTVSFKGWNGFEYTTDLVSAMKSHMA